MTIVRPRRGAVATTGYAAVVGALVVLAALTDRAAAQMVSLGEPILGASIFADQDFLSPWTNEDRNYTMGVGIGFSGRAVRWASYPNRVLFGGVEGLLTRAFLDDFDDAADLMHRHDLLFVVSAFTPDSLSLRTPPYGDRPWGSIVGLSARRLKVPIENRSTGEAERYPMAIRTEIVVGFLGLRLADRVQTRIHEAIDAELPLGWPTQISDGGELIGLARINVEKRISDALFCRNRGDDCHSPPLYQHKNFEATWMGEVTAGYMTSLATGPRVRIGKFASEFWDHDAAPLGTIQQNAGGDIEARYDIFAFGGLGGRFIAYNALLQGGRKDNAYQLGTNDMRRGILEWQIGAVVAVPIGTYWKIGAGYLFSGRTSEIDGPFARRHSWGSAFLSLTRVPVDE